ncbi:hypothetical protein AO896_13735 [Pseudomonas aeruginosa]|uniref:PBS lyase n=1 Tax=Pseudomonas paraeruginosa (strain DSM 24068 / PA7) TaxID=381754 RepID=A6VBX3_PSEP7|nr:MULTISPECIES: hypothetical protein [Pseudomonas aeruginosa group]ABR86555.1 hypothetical protein PSPA7_5226 [Pseudomonas aeruginosa PA7]KSC51743.1 hypothetical protein AO882_05045 [Pseudomonas paraeruginosa]KSC89432.1 hypothetical protein AO896_13735 [Pseudomonas aeruginosa]KSD24585.1 hypothetical protein AO898_08245 [Pseudomonas aeruginosa]KSG48833.1 hypothetical protein AO955_15350 [Pseudomonas aeruginosa]
MQRLKLWLQRQRQAPFTDTWTERHRREALGLVERRLWENDVDWVELSRSCNGFVREAAVLGLSASNDAEALAALIERANDWVGPVRAAAREGLERYLVSECVPALLGALPQWVALGRKNRADHGDLLDRLAVLLAGAEHRGQVLEALLRQRSASARFLLEVLLRPGQSGRFEVLERALSSPDPSVRRQALHEAAALPPDSAIRLLESGLRDHGASLRAQALHLYDRALGAEPLPAAVQARALLDASPSVRNLALYLAKAAGTDVDAILAERLAWMPTTKADWLGLLGLARDRQAQAVAPLARQALRHPAQQVRGAALDTLAALPAEDLADACLQALRDPSGKVFAKAAQCLRSAAPGICPQRLDEVLRHLLEDAAYGRADRLLALKPYWQQLDYLLQTRPELAADAWQPLLFAWRERRSGAIDYATSPARREELLEHLQALQEQGLLSRQIVIDALR